MNLLFVYPHVFAFYLVSRGDPEKLPSAIIKDPSEEELPPTFCPYTTPIKDY